MSFQLERMLRKASRHTAAGEPIPLDLAAELFALGVDVDKL